MRTDSKRQNPQSNDPRGVRLNKYLAQCGVASRRSCDRLIEMGRVTVNGKPVSEMGTRVFPSRDEVKVNGIVARQEETRVFMVHKPRNVLSTVYDPEGRRTVLELVPDCGLRLYPVGRLDRNSEGLLLVTNDGDLSLRLTHPRYHIEKEYLVWTREPLTEAQINQMKSGVNDEGERLRALDVESLDSPGDYALCRMLLGEGRNRHIRRMAEAVDSEVTRIKRIRMAGLDVKELPVGEYRELSPGEIARLKRLATPDA